MIDQWIRAQQIGVAAYCTRAFSALPDPRASRFWDEARCRLPVLLDEWEWKDDKRMQALPTSTLHLLAAVSDDHLDEPFDRGRLRQQAENALRFLIPEKESPLAKATAIAHHIMHGRASAKRITRLGASLFGRTRSDPTRERIKQPTWRRLETPATLKQLDEILSQLRSPLSTTKDRLGYVNTLLELIGRTPSAAQIGAVLYTHLFCWPLLVFDGPDEKVGIALPLAVDVRYPPQTTDYRPVKVDWNSVFDITGVSGQNPKTWLSHLNQARSAAILLWQRTHGHYLQSFKQQVKEHQVIYDFNRASEIVAGALGANEANRLPLTGGSASAYLSQIVLARLLGKRWFLSSAVTGSIGARVKPRLGYDNRDFEIEAVGGVAAKVRYMFESRALIRVVLPMSSGVQAEVRAMRAVEKEHRRADTVARISSKDGAEVHYAKTLCKVADIVQVEGWRKTAFIRCPEIPWTLVNPEARQAIPQDKDEMERILDRLAIQTNCVLRLDNVRPMAVASALLHINQRIHQNNQPHPPPGLSWCMVRVIEEEHGAGFWHTLWRLIGAPFDEYELLRDSPNQAIAAARLAHNLNLAPTQQCPSHRAPDIIVIVGAEQFSQGTEKKRPALAHLLEVAPLMKSFESKDALRVSDHRNKPEIRDHVGLVRIILLPDSDSDPVPQPRVDLDSLAAPSRQALEALATFRFGFSQNMASLVLSECNVSGYDVGELLENLVEQKALRVLNGEFHMTRELRNQIETNISADAVSLAQRHIAASVGLAPYSVSAPVPSLAYDAAFLPEHVSEACVHLMSAKNLLGELGNTRSQNMVSRGLQRICRFAMLLNWEAVDLLNRGKLGRDAYELAIELLDAWRDHNGAKLSPHPIHYVKAMKALLNWEPQQKRREDIERLYNKGIEACPVYPSDEPLGRLQLHYVMSMYLYSFFWPELREEIERIDEQIWQLQAYWDDLAGDWFEKNGDSETFDAAAANHYLLGTRHAPRYCQNWVKYVGAAQLAELDNTAVRQHLDTLILDDTRRMISWAEKSNHKYIRNGDHRPPYVKSRWAVGLTVLREIWRRRTLVVA